MGHAVDSDRLCCWFTGCCEFPVFKLRSCTQSLNLKTVSSQAGTVGHCPRRPYVMLFPTTWLPGSRFPNDAAPQWHGSPTTRFPGTQLSDNTAPRQHASQGHGCLGGFAVNRNRASVLRNSGSRTATSRYSELTTATPERPLQRKLLFASSRLTTRVFQEGLRTRTLSFLARS